MFKLLNEKKKYLPVLIGLILLFLSYQLAFKLTIDAWQLNTSLKLKLSSFNVSHRPQPEQKKRNELDRLLKIYKIDTSDFRSRILSDLSTLAEENKVRLVEIPLRDPSNQTPEALSQKLDFEGDYFSILRFLNRTEQSHNLGFIHGVTLKAANKPANVKSPDKIILEMYLTIISN